MVPGARALLLRPRGSILRQLQSVEAWLALQLESIGQFPPVNPSMSIGHIPECRHSTLQTLDTRARRKGWQLLQKPHVRAAIADLKLPLSSTALTSEPRTMRERWHSPATPSSIAWRASS